ncbi:MAG: ATP-dependent DNA helicase [Methanoregulaceae archaeon]|nr:ATP-dependent DNA helicase [Methanoregulaceae archaeon]
MDKLDAYFPYESYRPYQREMLERVGQVAREGGIAMIDAPTGSGKSSVVAALLAERAGRKIFVAVRTISQLNTFIRELELIRRKKRTISYSYLIGKRSLCMLPGEGDVYRRCEGVKAVSTNLMRERAEQGSLVPSKDPVITHQIRRLDEEHPVICPYYIRSRIFLSGEGSGLRMVPSTPLKAKAERVARELARPDELRDIGDGICPYEMLLFAAQRSDVIVVNYHHLFDEEIRNQLYGSLGIEPADVMLLIDEAHNCGDVMTGIMNVVVGEPVLAQADREISGIRRHLKSAAAIRQIIANIAAFMQGLKNSHETEDWFDPAIFDRMVVRGSLYKDMSAVVEDLMKISEYIREKNMTAGEYSTSSTEILTAFLFRLSCSSTDPGYLTVYRREEAEIFLEVRSIDPSERLRDLALSHHCSILISGTLSPVESYQRYYFGDLPVLTCSLPNVFPKKNRMVLCAGDITTAFSMRENRENSARIAQYIRNFSRVKGNIAVYFPSYQILDTYTRMLSETLASRNLIIEPKDARDAGEALRTFLSLPSRGKSGILFAVAGGKWSEGLDYRGELLSGAMVIGLPLAPYNRVRQMTIDYFRHKFGNEGEFISYTLPALNRAQQAIGRVLRTPEDRGILIFGEKRFLETRVRNGLPGWIREELVECTAESFGEAMKRWK